MIDLRSDTVTAPSQPMRSAIARAEVGDDVYGDDPTVRLLEERVADLFGYQAALFTATGSLANLLGVMAVTRPNSEVICESTAHIVRAEMGAHARLFGTTTRTWTHPRGRIDLDAIAGLLVPDAGPYLVSTSAVSVENTHNFGGGTVQRHADLVALVELAHHRGVAVHIDGARIWNAHVASGVGLKDLTAGADVLCVCLSKGLGAPVGSVVVGSANAVAEARVWRKRLGGGWRQAGLLAAAGLYALDHNIERIADDHANARLIGAACGVDPSEIDSNIVVIPVDDALAVAAQAAEQGVLCSVLGPARLRAVTHLGISQEQAAHAATIISGTLRPSR